jgi:indolepyruvate ferredoxin oxidoreductase beta subunit
MMQKTENVILCGTGGQGILLASEVLSTAAINAGMDVKKSEVHGMAQRGGSVSSHVRFGEKVYSPLVEKGTADLVMAMEKMEGLRWAPYLSPSGMLILSDLEINPMTVNTGQAEYPDVMSLIEEQGIPYRSIPAFDIAEELGNFRVLNVVLIGAVSSMLSGIPDECWQRALEERVPARALDVNIEAFSRGKALML